MTPMGEAMMAKDLGLDQEIASPLKIEGEDEEQMFLHNNVRIWEQVIKPTRESFKQAFPTVDTEVNNEL